MSGVCLGSAAAAADPRHGHHHHVASASGPIIEACDDCRFAAYACTWSGVHAEQDGYFRGGRGPRRDAPDPAAQGGGEPALARAGPGRLCDAALNRRLRLLPSRPKGWVFLAEFQAAGFTASCFHHVIARSPRLIVTRPAAGLRPGGSSPLSSGCRAGHRQQRGLRVLPAAGRVAGPCVRRTLPLQSFSRSLAAAGAAQAAVPALVERRRRRRRHDLCGINQ